MLPTSEKSFPDTCSYHTDISFFRKSPRACRAALWLGLRLEVVVVAQLGSEGVAAQRLLDEDHRLGGAGQAPSLGPVGGEHGVDRVRRQRLAEFGPRRAVAG